jgi:hypothetical protein
LEAVLPRLDRLIEQCFRSSDQKLAEAEQINLEPMDVALSNAPYPIAPALKSRTQ